MFSRADLINNFAHKQTTNEQNSLKWREKNIPTFAVAAAVAAATVFRLVVSFV